MRVALYGRVSTADKEQNLDTQLIPLRAFAEAQGWTEVREYTDQASATDLLHRESWRQLLDAASKRKVDLIVVWRLDRAFRSVLDAANTLERLRGWGVGLRSYQEPWLDTTSPFGGRGPVLHHRCVRAARARDSGRARSCRHGSGEAGRSADRAAAGHRQREGRAALAGGAEADRGRRDLPAGGGEGPRGQREDGAAVDNLKRRHSERRFVRLMSGVGHAACY